MKISDLSPDIGIIEANLSDRLWRLNHLYWIIDRNGNKIPFRMNWAQKDLYQNMWYSNVILKARQLGFSTFIGILFLDACLFNDNVCAGIIAHRTDDSEKLFNRVRFAYDNLHPAIRLIRKLTVETKGELKFNNGSFFYIDTSMRSSTLQYLHISEFGKICAKYPNKATEIMTGSLNAVAIGQYTFIESTAEGSAGYFYDIYKGAEKKAQKKLRLTELDYKPHFYPWWKEPSYVLHEFIEPPRHLREYFEKLSASGIELSGSQISWYCKKYEVQEDAMFQEFPSTAEEAFQGSASGLFYGRHLTNARIEKRIGNIPYDENALVHTAWDIGGAGGGDYTAIWFFQIVGHEIHIIDFYQDNGKSLAEYIYEVKQRRYSYGEHLAPHDIKVTEYSNGMSRLEVARTLGFDFTVVDKLLVMEGIDAARGIFPRCWFDQNKCEEGLRMLENYRKEWDERLVRWKEKPLHDFASNAADAFRYLAVGFKKIEGTKGSLESDYKALKAYWG